MKLWIQLAAVLASLLLQTSCEDEYFDDDTARIVIEKDKLPLSGEQVFLTPDQVICGEKKGLWLIDQLDSGGGIARLTSQGRALEFGDDVRMGDHKFTNPYVQLQGKFPVKLEQVKKVTDQGTDAKIVEARIAVIVNHECFEQPLRLMGIERGDFSEDALPRVRLRLRGAWTADKVLH